MVGGQVGAVVISGVNFDSGLAPLHAGGRSDWRQPEGLLASLPDGYPGRGLDVRNEGGHVPRIIAIADSATDTVMLSERIGVADLDSEHFRATAVGAPVVGGGRC